MNETVDGIIRERRESGEDLATEARPPELHAVRRRQEDRRAARRPQHPLPDHHLPDRGPRDDERAAVVRDLRAPEQSATSSPAPTPRSTACSGRTRRATPTLCAGQPAHLRRADPEGDAAALADRAGLRAGAAQGHDDRRPVQDEEELPDRGARRRRCTATRPCGASRPTSSTPTTSAARPSARGPPMPTSPSATASAPASAASSRCRRRRSSSA